MERRELREAAVGPVGYGMSEAFLLLLVGFALIAVVVGL